jgi:hypothetical protein
MIAKPTPASLRYAHTAKEPRDPRYAGRTAPKLAAHPPCGFCGEPLITVTRTGCCAICDAWIADAIS